MQHQAKADNQHSFMPLSQSSVIVHADSGPFFIWFTGFVLCSKLCAEMLNTKWVFPHCMKLQCLTTYTELLSTSDLILILSHPLALVPPSIWHFASLTGGEPAESRLGLTRCLCLSHRELWNTETHWLHLTLGIWLPCRAWYNRTIHCAFCTSMLTFIAALIAKEKRKDANCYDAVNNCRDAYLEPLDWSHSLHIMTQTLKWDYPTCGSTPMGLGWLQTKRMMRGEMQKEWLYQFNSPPWYNSLSLTQSCQASF